MSEVKPTKNSLALAWLILVQALCTTFFIADAIADTIDEGRGILTDPGQIIEGLAALSLLFALGVEMRVLMILLRRQKDLERTRTVAQGALHEVIQAYFEDWALTPSEADVAGLTLKGLSIAEVAEIRGSAEGTVKAHLNAIYRKAGVQGRNGLMSLLIEDLMGAPLVPHETPEDAGATLRTGGGNSRSAG
ncbi:helix-turn-helix transcriptional regulator [Maritimibacter alkaliphilus]|uniref:helix-turn-helix transcriptional regulator n=1 Tax=Maritimibacter alkaliphilus TaxID=404236 RepID=UPI001C9745B8|nr:helix-turn-helix transcriptional regulator [Maritimibacter alkaliphilus]MBY6089462.1 helix-turn-helix transcriptional regulator [Maritimibacter alkaliphilus]